MNIAEAFATYLDTNTAFTLGQDLFIGQAPSSPDSLMWIEASGGDVERRAKTGETMKSYLVQLRYRNMDYEAVYDTLHDLEETFNSSDCITLSGYETIQIQATTFPIDEDLDSEGRKVGLLGITITTYKE